MYIWKRSIVLNWLSSHGMLAIIIIKKFVHIIFVYMWYFSFIRLVFSMSRTTEEYSENFRYVTLRFLFFSWLHNTWHCYLYFAKTMAATLFQQSACFLKLPSFINCIVQPFHKYLLCNLSTIIALNCITNCILANN